MAPLLAQLLPLVGLAAGLRSGSLVKSPGLYPWAGKNGNAQRTGASSFVAPRALSKGPTWSFHEQMPWDEIRRAMPEVEAKFGHFHGLIRATPLVDDKLNVYLSTVSYGRIYKFSPEGQQLWSFIAGYHDPSIQLPGIPALLDGKLYSATSKGEVFALDMETGKKLWNKTFAPFIAGDTWSMAAAEGVVIVPAVLDEGAPNRNNRRLVAFRASDGEHLWTFESPQDLYNILVSIKDGSCVFSTAVGQPYRLDLQTGKPIWKVPLTTIGFSTGGSVLGNDGETVFTTWNEYNGTLQEGKVGAYSFADGRRLWSASTGTYEANNAPAVGVLGSGSGARLSVVVGVGLNPTFPNPAEGVFSGRGGEVRPARVVALDAATGARRWVAELPAWRGAALGDDSRPDICLPDAFSNVAIGGDGTAYVGFANGNLYSLRDDDGDGLVSGPELSAYQTGAAFQGSPAVAPGLLAVTSCDGLHVWRLPKQ